MCCIQHAENCLNLDAWQEFFGFDREGQEGWFDIQVDTKSLTLEVSNSEKMPKTNRLRPDQELYVHSIPRDWLQCMLRSRPLKISLEQWQEISVCLVRLQSWKLDMFTLSTLDVKSK